MKALRLIDILMDQPDFDVVVRWITGVPDNFKDGSTISKVTDYPVIDYENRRIILKLED